jgi:hypothetical protein
MNPAALFSRIDRILYGVGTYLPIRYNDCGNDIHSQPAASQ